MTGGTGLPSELSSFVGRRGLLSTLRELLLGDARLVTATGTGGVGKTRLALRAAAELEGEVDVRLVDLTGVPPNATVAELTAAMITLLGLPDHSGRGLDVLRQFAAERPRLLVVDNCEHVVDAAGALIAALLSAGASLRVLATSRESLGVPGEHVVTVAPLDVPAEGSTDSAPTEALELLRDRARQVLGPDWDFTPATRSASAALCRALDVLEAWIAALQGSPRTTAVWRECVREAESVPGGLDPATEALYRFAEGTVLWMTLDDPRGLAVLDRARLLFTALGRRPDIYLSTLFCAIAAAAPQDTAAGRNAAALLTAMAAERGGDWSHEWALWVTALSMRHTDPAGAAEKLRAALRLGVPIGDLWGVGWGIEVLSWVTATRGDHLHAARLFGAADRNWEVFGLDLGALIPLGRERRRWQQQVRRALSERDYDNAYRAGLALDRAAAIDLALADDAPAQPALTRREMEVAELVRAGLTNRQIASQLRLSPRTVETHLAHIQAKLGVPNRAAIAAWHAQSTG